MLLFQKNQHFQNFDEFMLDLIFDLIVVVNALNEVNFFDVSKCVDKKNSDSTKEDMISKKSHTNVDIDNVQLIDSCLNECSLFSAFDHDYDLIALCIAVGQKVDSKKVVTKMFSIEVCAKIENFD